jgi:hypothetical protein
MSIIYRKSLKGIDELAFKTSGLPMRLMSYLTVIDGETGVEQLTARHPQLPSMAIVLQGLAEQGFLEVAGAAANVVQMPAARVANGGPIPMGAQPVYAQQPMQQPIQQPMQQPMQQPAMQAFGSPELDMIKASMVKDVSGILGADAAPVIQKIQNCRSKDDLFGSMMGIKKIITIYANAGLAEKFAARYQSLI